MMEQYRDFFEANRQSWNLRAAAHKSTTFYDVEAWKAGKDSLQSIELREMGDVRGKTLLHLQCHFGQDTLSWARHGAQVTGCDLSDTAIEYARQLAAETGLEASFICCNVYDLPQHLAGKFDIVFASYGVVGWLPDLKRWAEVIAHFLKPGGYFYFAEFHPVIWMFDDNLEKLTYSYQQSDVIVTDNQGTYADQDADIQYRDYSWNHSLSEVINSLIGAGLRLEFLNEYPFSPYNCFPKTVKGEDGNYRIQGLENIIPMVYSLKATKISYQ